MEEIIILHLILQMIKVHKKELMKLLSLKKQEQRSKKKWMKKKLEMLVGHHLPNFLQKQNLDKLKVQVMLRNHMKVH